MKPKLRAHVAAILLLAPAAATLTALPSTAAAATRPAPAPRVAGLSLNSDDGLRAGADLQFALEGTPRGRASVALGKTSIVVPLKETSAGMYRGTYTVRSKDRIDPTAVMTARLSLGGRTALHNFSYPPSFLNVAMGAGPAPVAIPVPLPRIEQFAVAPVNRLEPGRELHFRLNGMPGAQASFDIPGVASNVAMREVSPGVYEGNYTVRQRDDLNAFGNVVATLRRGDHAVTAKLERPLLRDREPPTIASVTPEPGQTVTATGLTTVAGTFEDAGGRGVDPGTVRIVVSGRDVTSQAQVSPRQFTWRSDLPPGRYTAEVNARDYAGNAVNRSWSFTVGGGNFGAAPPAPGVLPLAVVAPSNNASVDANGNIVVRGRTAPWAHVAVRVDAVAPVLGNRLGVAQNLASETLQADREGYFSATLEPRGALPIPGTRLDVSLTATSGSQTAEQKIVLYQRQG